MQGLMKMMPDGRYDLRSFATRCRKKQRTLVRESPIVSNLKEYESLRRNTEEKRHLPFPNDHGTKRLIRRTGHPICEKQQKKTTR